MSDEHDSWMKSALGVDIGGALEKIKDGAVATFEKVEDKVVEVVKGAEAVVEGAVGEVAQAVGSVVQKVANAVSSPSAPPAGASSAGSFPLKGSVGRGGQNAAGDVRAVQAALGIGADGQCGPQTISAIEAFQRKLGGKADGRVDPGGATERGLTSGGAGQASVPAPGLLDRALAGAKGLATGIVELGSDLVGVADDALDNGALLNQLKRPSYVANSDGSPPPEGGNASAGDSFFVTGAQKGSLVQSVKNLKAVADAINKVGTDLEKKGVHEYWFDDKQMLQSAKNLHATAGAILKLATALDRGDVNKGTLDKGNTVIDYADKVMKAGEAVAAIRNLSLSSENLEKKTSEATVNAWADGVGDAFDKAGALIDLIPKGALPGFVTDYYKGLFSAPKNYIGAFKTLMKVHYGSIDKEAGISHADRQAEDLGKTGLNWEGDLTTLFVGGYVLPKSGAGEFQRYMVNHRKEGGIDLYAADLQVGKAVLTTAIVRDISEDDPARDAWVTYVAQSK